MASIRSDLAMAHQDKSGMGIATNGIKFYIARSL